jgi:excisionase family DNA binding protein
MSSNPKLLTVRQVSVLLSVPVRTIQRWVQEGRLPGLRIAKTTRIPSSAIDALLVPLMGDLIRHHPNELEGVTVK